MLGGIGQPAIGRFSQCRLATVVAYFDQTLAGSDFVTNGGFDDGASWTATSPWTIAAGVASIDGSQGGNTALTQSISITQNM